MNFRAQKWINLSENSSGKNMPLTDSLESEHEARN